MNVRRKLAFICAASALLAFSGCRSAETGQGEAAGTSPALISQPGNGDDDEREPAFSARTEIINGQAYAVETTGKPRSPEDTVILDFDVVPTDRDIDLELSSGADVLTTDVDFITLTVRYIGDGNALFIIDEDYAVERLADGKWEPAYKPEFIYDMGMEVSRYSSPQVEISLEDIDAPGSYRIVKTINGADLYAYFELVQNGEEPQYNVEAENGTLRLLIDEVKEDEFLCEMTFPLPTRYHVICDTAQYPDFRAGDYIKVDFSVMYSLSQRHFSVIPESIIPDLPPFRAEDIGTTAG